jgi:hypothetical protein
MFPCDEVIWGKLEKSETRTRKSEKNQRRPTENKGSFFGQPPANVTYKEMKMSHLGA